MTDHPVLMAAEAVRQARMRYAEEYLRFRIRSNTDGNAHQQAVLETGDELTVLQARLWLAKMEADRDSGRTRSDQ